MNITGHFWTIAPNLRHRLLPKQAPAAEPWQREFTTKFGGGMVRLSGLWREEPNSNTALVVIHGLGGTVSRQYCVSMAQAAARRGWSCLRIALRGADRRGSDFYHAELVEDLEAAWADEALRRFGTIHVVGFSLGGHLALRFAALGSRPQLGCTAAVCPPVDLDHCATFLDEQAPRVYLKHVLNGLNEIYASVASRADVPTPVERMRDVKTIREWDSLTIVPRYGYVDADDYYRSESVLKRLGQIETPTLVLASSHDPMLPIRHLRSARDAHPDNLHWLLVDRGGHVGFPPRMSLGQPAPLGWPHQLCALMDSVAAKNPV